MENILIIVSIIWFATVLVLAGILDYAEGKKAKREKKEASEKKEEGDMSGYIPYSNRRSSIPTKSEDPSQSRQIYENLFKGAKWGFD